MPSFDAVSGIEEGLETLTRAGLHMSEQGTNGVESYRVAIVYGACETRAEAP
jgi:hypothetical protein